jgi:phosphodiesterase/alkaline phosphatase D-like protein
MKRFKNFATVGLLASLFAFTAFYPSSQLSTGKTAGSASPDELLSPTDFLVLTQEYADQGNNEAGDEFGMTLATGDFDNDGFMDLAVGAPGEAPGSDPKSGFVFVFQGSGAGPAGGTFEGLSQGDDVPGAANEDGDLFGAALAAGDFNNDGFDDLAVGAPGEAPGSDPKSGAVFIFSGSANGLTTGRFITQRNAGGANEAGDQFGFSLAAGDFNKDGKDDLAVGAPGEAPFSDPQSGAVFIFPGSDSGLTSGGVITQRDAGGMNEAGDQFGFALAAGDFNGGGFDDLAIGAPGEAPGSDPKSGAVFVFLGSGSGLSSGSVITQRDAGGANEAMDQFGFALAAGDVNGGGFDDLAIGAPGEAPGSDPKSGAVFVFLGSGSGLGSGSVVTQRDAGGANEASDQFGFALAAGDLNGDDKDDLAVGAPGEAPGSDPKSGAVFVFSGSSSGIGMGRVLDQEDIGGANENDDRFGRALVIGDYNKDGADDVAIGAPGEAPFSDPKSGAVFVNAGLRIPPVLTHGGLLGAVTDTSIKIWARADQPATLKVQYKLPIQAWPGITSPGVSLMAAQDFTGVVMLTDLTPDTTYDYRLLLNDVVQPGSEAPFRTLKLEGASGTFRFAIGADTRFSLHPFPIFDKIQEQQPDFMFLMGDQIYSDIPAILPDSKAIYERKYKENWAEACMRDFMKRIPMFMIWDDHEIRNNYWMGRIYEGETTDRYANGKAAYDEYQGSHNPEPRVAGQNYYAFRVGQADFYVLDTRSFRSPNDIDDMDMSETMLGEAQKADLLNWLSSSSAKFKVIVSSVGWRNLNPRNNDSWDGFRVERDEIFDHVKKNNIRGVVLLSGDQHFASVHCLDGLYEFNATPLGVRPDTTLPMATAAQECCQFNTTRVYGLFQVDTTVTPARLTFDVYDEDGDPVGECYVEITEDYTCPPCSP